MTHIQRIEFEIKTGNGPQGNAGSDSRIFCFIAGREFRLDKSGNPFGQGDNDLIVAGIAFAGRPAPNISNPTENDPNNYRIEIANLPFESQTVPRPPGVQFTPTPIAGTTPQPIFIRYVPKDQQKGWQLEDAHVRVVNENDNSFPGWPANGNSFFEFQVTGGPSNNRWLGDKFGTSVGLELSGFGPL